MDPNERNLPDVPEELAGPVRALRARAQSCPRPDLLQAAHGRVLPEELAEPVLRHVQNCLACRTLLENIDALEAEPLEAGQQQRIWKRIELERRGSWFRWLWPWPAAAALCLVLAASVMMRVRQQTVASRPVPPARKPAGPVLAWEKAPIVLPPAALLVWRGKSSTGMWQEVQTALLRYQSGDYNGAAELLEPLTKKYPNLAEAWFYLGVCRLSGKANEKALTNLEQARKLAQPPLADQVPWYLALAYERTGKVGEARKVLEAQCADGGDQAARACRGARSLPVTQ
jgi:TolA-binding protein